LAAFLLVLLFSLWRAARDLAGHARAGAELVAHVLARQGMAQETGMYERVEALLPGLGSVKPVQIDPGSVAAGRTLGELNLRGRTGATVVGISRQGLEIPHPVATERLEPGDLVALTGSRDAVQAARRDLERRAPA
jgi:CPA2 family monovalent cation:H+ antiporter-2